MCIGKLSLVCFSICEVQAKMHKITPFSRWALITSPPAPRRPCVPGVCALLHFEFLFIKSWRMQKDQCLSPSVHGLCVQARFPFSLPSQPQRPPPQEVMGGNVDVICQETTLTNRGARDKTGTRWSHSGQLSCRPASHVLSNFFDANSNRACRRGDEVASVILFCRWFFF